MAATVAQVSRQWGASAWISSPPIPMDTPHASLNNQIADRLQRSTATRYPLAPEPVDERWIGEHPIAHGTDSRHRIIC